MYCITRRKSFFSGEFVQVPNEMQKWHKPGERIGFYSDSIFDWAVNDNGHLHGGFTIRAARERLPDARREAYDRFVGVSVYEPVPV